MCGNLWRRGGVSCWRHGEPLCGKLRARKRDGRADIREFPSQQS